LFDTHPAGNTRATTTHQSVSYLQTDLRKGLGAYGGGLLRTNGSIALVRAGQYPKAEERGLRRSLRSLG